MSIKKLLVLSAAGLVAVGSTAFAGGPDDMGPPVDHSAFHPSLYVEANGGYSFYNWKRVNINRISIWDTGSRSVSTNREGGFVGGLDVGVNLLKHMGVELGGYYLPRIKGDPQNTAAQGKGTQYNWMAYAATRFAFAAPYVDGLEMFAKVGAMYRGMSNTNFPQDGSNSQYQAGAQHYWTYMFGAGFAYELMGTGFTANMQWIHLPGYSGGSQDGTGKENQKDIGRQQPDANMLTLGLGYKFDL